MSIQICEVCEQPKDTDFWYMHKGVCEYCCEDICEEFDNNLSLTIVGASKRFNLTPGTIKSILMEQK